MFPDATISRSASPKVPDSEAPLMLRSGPPDAADGVVVAEHRPSRLPLLRRPLLPVDVVDGALPQQPAVEALDCRSTAYPW
jgi:hypothetical protein